MISRLHIALWLAVGCISTALPVTMAARTVDASPSATPAVELCSAHGADASMCFLCDATLRDQTRLWCGEHGRYEDRCWMCHPELQDQARLYCDEHGLYEDECFVCHPELTAREAPEATISGSALYCGEHDLVEIECGICHPELADGLAPGGALKIRLPGTASAAKAGVVSDHPAPAPVSTAVQALGEVGYDRDRLARVTPLVEGVVRSVHVELGDRVDAGQALVTVASRAVAQAQAEYRAASAAESAALRSFDREQELFELEVSSERDLDAARTALASLRAQRVALEQDLLDLGFTSNSLRAIARGERSGSTLVLTAPFAGTVIARDVVPGDMATIGEELLRVARLDEMWVSVALPERDLASITPGQPLEVRSATTGLQARGVVTWVSSEIDATTRTALVRATIANPDGRWKAGMFVDVRISTGAPRDALAVPTHAVHHFGGVPFVFVDLSEGLYEVRRVELSGTPPRSNHTTNDQAHIFVTAGLSMHELVVTERSFLVKSEFQKSRLGAGCVD